jgi:hypothetical protein
MSNFHTPETSSSQSVSFSPLPYSRSIAPPSYNISQIEKITNVSSDSFKPRHASEKVSGTTTEHDYHPPPPSYCDTLSPSLNYPLFKKSLAFSVHALETEDFLKKHV